MAIYADDLHPDQRIALGQYTLTEEEMLAFARQWDPIFIHTDPEAARATPLGGVVASGLHTMAVYQRLAVEALWSDVAGGIGRSFEIQFRRPVRPGTTLSGQLTVRSVEPRSAGQDADVVIDAELTDEQDVVVLRLTNRSVLPLRGRESAS